MRQRVTLVPQSAPENFFSGEAQRAGVPLGYSGFYIGGTCLTALLISPLAGRLLGIVGASEVQRVAFSLPALCHVSSLPRVTCLVWQVQRVALSLSAACPNPKRT